jgi:hypothetical protein
MKTYPDVRTGQVWRDRDRRMLSGNRRVRVIETCRDGAGPKDVHVKYRAVFPNGEMHGPTFQSQWHRFQRAFVLVEASQN